MIAGTVVLCFAAAGLASDVDVQSAGTAANVLPLGVLSLICVFRKISVLRIMHSSSIAANAITWHYLSFLYDCEY